MVFCGTGSVITAGESARGSAAAAPITRESPLSAIVSGCVFDLDATLTASYDGTSQRWSNLITAPADGAAQSAYNVTRGAAISASTDDPTFVGTAGDAAAYFNLDGGDFFQLEGSNTTFLNSLHRTDITQPFTLGYVVRTSSTTATAGICTSRAVTSNSGQGVATVIVNGAWSAIGMSGDTAVVVGYDNPPPSYSNATNFLIIVSYDPATTTLRSWANGTLVSSSFTKNTSVTNPPDAKMRIGAYNNGAFNSSNGSRYYAAFALNEFIDSTKAAAIKAHYELRHGRTY